MSGSLGLSQCYGKKTYMCQKNGRPKIGGGNKFYSPLKLLDRGLGLAYRLAIAWKNALVGLYLDYL